MTRPLNAVRLVTPSAQLVTKTVGRARAGTAMAAPFSAPRTSFNGTITGHRAIALADMDLEDIRQIKNATGTTVNDVVLAIAGGALRAYLADRDELPRQLAAGDRAGLGARGVAKRSGGANKVSALFAKLGTDTEDPLERLRDLAERNQNAKEHHQAISADSLQDWAEFAAPRTFGLAVRAYAGLRLPEKHPVVHNLVISNVPGPPVPLYFMGARIDALYPLGPVFHGAGAQHHRDVEQRPGPRRRSSPAASRCRTSTTWCGASRPSWRRSGRPSTRRRRPTPIRRTRKKAAS